MHRRVVPKRLLKILHTGMYYRAVVCVFRDGISMCVRACLCSCVRACLCVGGRKGGREEIECIVRLSNSNIDSIIVFKCPLSSWTQINGNQVSQFTPEIIFLCFFCFVLVFLKQ